MNYHHGYGQRPRQSKKEIVAEIAKLHGPRAQTFVARLMDERQGKSTTISVSEDGTEIEVRHWATTVAVLRVQHDGVVSCRLWTRGHWSVTTKKCLNDILRFAGVRGNVWQKNHQWFVNGRPFKDGIEVCNAE